MRLAPFVLALAASVTAFDADACSTLVSKRDIRSEALKHHDGVYEKWFLSITRRLAESPDNEIAWAGAMLSPTGDDNDISVPALPTTGLGRLMRYAWCDGSRRCPGALAQWLAAEPDNLFVLALAMDERNTPLADEARERLAYATRYDDYTIDAQALGKRISALPDTEPPPAPEGYERPALGCIALSDARIQSHIDGVMLMAVSFNMHGLKSAPVDAPVKLRLADLLLASPRSIHAAEVGAQIGNEVATDPIDRERYCRAEARADAQDDALSWLVTDAGAVRGGERAAFYDALRTRNALDAVDAVAAQLPASRRPDPVDPERVAACVAGRD